MMKIPISRFSLLVALISLSLPLQGKAAEPAAPRVQIKDYL